MGESKMKKRIFLALLMLPLLFTGNQIREVKAEGAPYQVTNGGFETGDLTGWKPYTIWKGETGVASWSTTNTRVVSSTSTYFQSDGHPYNIDGNFGLGITWQPSGSGVDWSKLAERMGHLRSSDFTLGGSGWISFKLGGGRRASFAHVSFRRSIDNVEVARFGNPMRNKTSFATYVYKLGNEENPAITNAEAFMFPYYFDLSTVASIGTELYITISETAGYEWAMLSADSFITHYADIPVIPEIPNTQEAIDGNWTFMATNIVPEILGVSTASRSIPNGNFVSGLDNWQNVDGAWKIQESPLRARSDFAGDGSIGVLRSSAFIVGTSDKYLGFRWSGGLVYDKQIFVSVKEVGTNNEILRFVRRTDDSGYTGDAMKTHYLDLSSLHPTMKYYLEFADNTTAGWGLAFIDSCAFITTSEYTDNTNRHATLIEKNPSFPNSIDSFSVYSSESFARYFLDITGPYCEAENSSGIPWNALGDLYAIQRDSTKNYFVGSSVSESLVLDARARYLHILKVHPAFESNPFMKNSSGTSYSGSYDPVLPITVQDDTGSTAIFVIATLSITLLGATLYVYTRKQQRS
jgi:hypothetical protein